MSLLTCTECYGVVSSHALFCPHCGCPIEIIKYGSVKDTSYTPPKSDNQESTKYHIPKNRDLFLR